MADAAAPTVEKVTADPVSVKSAPAAAPAPAPPADMAVESISADGKAKDKPEASDVSAEKPAKQENDAAPEAVMQEPEPATAPPPEERSTETQKDDKSDGADAKEASGTDGDTGDVDMESKIKPETGEKRKADQQASTNGSNGAGHEKSADEKPNKPKPSEIEAPAPAGKKQKTNGTKDPAPTRKASRGKKEKKPVAPVGKTARRTRSQGPA